MGHQHQAKAQTRMEKGPVTRCGVRIIGRLWLPAQARAHPADRTFQLFQQLHSQVQFAGTGIGLTICEKVAPNHGDGITVASQPNQGATFSIYLPA